MADKHYQETLAPSETTARMAKQRELWYGSNIKDTYDASCVWASPYSLL